MAVSEPAPSSVPAGRWEYIGLGDGAGPSAIMASGESSARTAPRKPPRPRTASSQSLEQRPLSRRASNRAPKQGRHQVGPGSIRGAGLGQEDRDGVY